VQVNKSRSSINLSLRSVLSGLIYFHLFIIFFQIPLREIILDVTVWRDIGIFLILLVWGAYRVVFFKPMFSKQISLKTVISVFIFYGILNLFINLINGVSLLEASTNFRNYYLPFLLFFPACDAFKNTKEQQHLISFLAIVLLFYMISPVLEFFLKILDFPLAKIPWYGYTFAHSDRFEGNELGGYIKQDESPILGFLGFPHYTVVPIVGLFALIFPFIFTDESDRDDIKFKIGKSSYYKYFLFFSFFSSIFIFQVRTHIISAFLLLFLFASKKIRLGRYLLSTIAGFILFFSLFSIPGSEWLGSTVDQFIAGFIGSNDNISSLSVIMSVNELLFILNSGLMEVFFGHGYNAVANASFDEFLGANSSGWEVKIFYFTAVHGLLWLILFVCINLKAFSYIKSNVRLFPQNSFEYMYSMGLKVMMLVFILDAGHYMRMMTWPNLDTWIICLGVLAAINLKGETRTLVING